MSVHRSTLRPTSGEPVGVVVVDADATQRRAIAGIIAAEARGRFVARTYASPEEAGAAVTADDRSIVIVDLETIGGPQSLAEIAAQRPLIAVSRNGSLGAAVAAMKSGASDFLAKPIGARVLLERLESALAGAPPVAPPTPEHSDAGDFAGFIGRSPAMLAVYEQIRRMAPSRAPVFITGESGTGKELCAEAIHALADPRRSARPFVAINCSAIPKDLIESEIFGHVRGAFTGASENRTGAAELADGGTLFLDEIAEMDHGLQAKLLRFLQTGNIRRVGGSDVKRVDVRIVCATNRDPAAEVAAGRLRADLFYRLFVLPIHMPPLRERGDDVLRIAEACLARYAREERRRFASFAADAVPRLEAHQWPGNVRELTNLVRRIVVLDDGDAVTAAMLPTAIGATGATGDTSAIPNPRRIAVLPFREHERQVIENALAAFDGNIARAAAALEISPSTIYRKRQAWPHELALLA